MSDTICITAPFSLTGVDALVAAGEASLEAVVILNLDYLRQHPYPETPFLYETDVRYRLDDSGGEEFLTIPAILERGWGDCDQLAAWRAAELRSLGQHATVRLRHGSDRPGDERIFHALVHRPPGRAGKGGFEDPSAFMYAKELKGA